MTTPNTVAEAKARALAELEAHRERNRRRREDRGARFVAAWDECIAKIEASPQAGLEILR